MTKHIAGLIIFTFIVGSSVVVAGLFSEAPRKLKSYSFAYDYSSCKGKKRKKRRRRRHRKPRMLARSFYSPLIKQAVFDQDSKLLSVSHVGGKGVYKQRRKMLVYHFYVKDEYGTRHIRSERVWKGHESTDVSNDFEWLSNRGSKDGLYLAAEFKSREGVWNIAPKFEDSGAVAILVKHRE